MSNKEKLRDVQNVVKTLISQVKIYSMSLDTRHEVAARTAMDDVYEELMTLIESCCDQDVESIPISAGQEQLLLW